MQDIRSYKILYTIGTISVINLMIHLYNHLSYFNAQHVTASPAKEVVLISKGDVVEVTVKRDEKAKRTSPIIISSPGQKAEKERSATSNNEMPRSWSSILAEQNLLYMKGQASKNNENKKAKMNSSAKRLQQNVSIIYIKYDDIFSIKIYTSKQMF